ncbi:hypothetical protein C0993_007189, partial [Termitomyces sp. T159_Od127]
PCMTRVSTTSPSLLLVLTCAAAIKVLEMITNLDVILNERLDLSSLSPSSSSTTQPRTRTVRTLPGRDIAADHVVSPLSFLTKHKPFCSPHSQLMCTGQTPNTRLLAALDPATVDPTTALARVLRTMQLCRAPPEGAAPPATAAEQATPTDTTPPTTPYPHIFPSATPQTRSAPSPRGIMRITR